MVHRDQAPWTCRPIRLATSTHNITIAALCEQSQHFLRLFLQLVLVADHYEIIIALPGFLYVVARDRHVVHGAKVQGRRLCLRHLQGHHIIVRIVNTCGREHAPKSGGSSSGGSRLPWEQQQRKSTDVHVSMHVLHLITLCSRES